VNVGANSDRADSFLRDETLLDFFDDRTKHYSE
jgi:hypothetical protein